MKYLDLFSGIGGFALGAYWAGWRFDRHYYSEIDPWCCRLYQQRSPDAVPLGDIRKNDGRTLVANAEKIGWGNRGETGNLGGEEGSKVGAGDQPPQTSDHRSQGWIISGGFPCQDISTAGKGAGITGTRSGLWFEYARLIGDIRPRYAIMENVGALTRRGLDRVLGSLAEIGYDAEWSDIRASDVGAPHRRERIWIVAYPNGMGYSRGRGFGGKHRGRSREEPKNRCEAVADTDNQGLQGHRGECELGEGGGEKQTGGSGAYVAHSSEQGMEGHRGPGETFDAVRQGCDSCQSCGEGDVSDTDREREQEQRRFAGQEEQPSTGQVRREVSHSSSVRLSGSGKYDDAVHPEESKTRETTEPVYGSRSDQWVIEPDVGRVAHGVPSRVDRLKGLGNAIVPQIAELIFRQLRGAS